MIVLSKIRRYYHKTWPFFMENLLTNELTFFKQKCYIHEGHATGLFLLCKQCEKDGANVWRQRNKEVVGY